MRVRRMEEASVAGESPDRSKQQESSVEPTSGSAGSVPGARDPRLTVSREKDSSSGTKDTATKVLSVRDVKAAAASGAPDSANSPESGTSSKPAAGSAEDDASTEPEAEHEAAAEDGDADLREAVSAWVRSAGDAKKPGSGADATAKKPEKPEGAVAEGESADAEGMEETEPEKEPAGKAGREPADGTDATAAAADDHVDAEAGTDANANAKTSPANGSDDDNDNESSDGEDTAPAASEDQDDDAPADEEADAAPDAAAEADAPQDAKPEPGPRPEPEDAKPEDSKSESEPEDAKPEDAEPEDAEPGSEPEDAEPASKSGAKPAPGSDPDSAPRPGQDGEDGKDSDGEDAPEAPRAKVVDQPTTALKALSPKKPAVDQPTTMLKLGSKPRPATPEAERTSKFVALKPDVTTAVPQVGPERTTQQPLPPKPPLDLLAELTNTPPPPETPVRTIVRRVKIWTPLVILLVIVLAVVQEFRPLPQPTLGLTAKDSYTFAGGKADIPWPSQGQAALDVQGIGSFGSSGTQKPVPIASLAKVMTAYLVLRDHPLRSGEAGPKITIDKPAEQQSDAGQESTVPVKAGDRISEREALEAILLPSANNVARLLARWDAGSEKAFVTKMNAAAKGLGMTNTTYTDPSGLTDSTVSTAVDQVKLAKKAMERPAFREVAAMMSYVDYKGVKHNNYNRLVGYNNVVGIKTGTTTSALGNLVFAAKQQVGGETRTIIGAAMRQPAGGSDNTIISGVLDAGDKLIRAGQGALKSATILKKGDVVGYVDDGLGGRTPVVATKDVTAAGWAGLKVKLSFAADTVPHTAKAGTKVGTLTVGDGGVGAVKVPVALKADLAEPGFADKLTRLG
ncbi:D-alanyl-D-alanine carboxypeptidase [Streptomyces collinus]|uniref:D-alanyl-D-alanine carboxypeptidase n=1 Tax=Streptomyces collinus TaxID=42684 RepID=UPI001F31B892|nr:D-alanyl-D-alanine carboxypeptidase [Streptomyces collinus]UJA08822.1 D-alanyl-D-alanine carboxypeptidase [Streptomyces collinus]UJA16314.1 D-alanyl-D-alanine carboxypeptidase [Streptomyces collinus]